MIDAAIGDGLLHRGSSRLEPAMRPCLLEEAWENIDLKFDMLEHGRQMKAWKVGDIPLHGRLECRREAFLKSHGH